MRIAPVVMIAAFTIIAIPLDIFIRRRTSGNARVINTISKY